MAGAGFKTFNTGDVLTASDVNTYLMQQTVMVFADASARSTALGANVAEGMISYLKDTNAVERYDGSSWGAIGAGDIEGVTAGAGLSGGGTSGTVTLNLASTAAGRNAVINGGFDIWQRGTSIAVNATTYTADRWCGYRGVAGMTVSRQSVGDSTNLPNIQYCTRIQRDSGNTSTTGLQYGQMVETVNAIPFAGKTVTLSFYARKGANYSPSASTMDAYIVTGTGTDQNYFSTYTGSVFHNVNATLTTTWQRFSGTFTLSSTLTEFAILMNSGTPVGTAGAADYFEITGVQLELGSSATPFSRAGGTIQGELAACQRYYYRNTAAETYSVLTTTGIASATSQVKIPVALPVTMRIAPTTLEYGSIAIYDGANLSGAPSAGGVLGESATSPEIYFNVTGLTQYRPYYVMANNSTSAYIALSAEL